MNKKGFTLIEIIICVSLIAIIGVASFFGVKTITKNIRVEKLTKIQDKIIQAAEVYLESNKEVSNQLHENKNGVVIPLNVLVNEGLLNLDNTDIKKRDYENEYIMTFLAAGSGNTSDCIDIRTATSWDEAMNEPIYICTQTTAGGGTNTNISIINPSELSNKNKVERKIFYYTGEYPNNNLKYTKDGTAYTMRILSVDTDDSLTVVKNDFCVRYDYSGRYNQMYADCSFEKIFTQAQSFTTLSTYDKTFRMSYINKKCATSNNTEVVQDAYYEQYTYGGLGLTAVHYDNTTECFELNSSTAYREYGYAYEFYEDKNWMGTNTYSYRYVHLKPCMKITSGTGASDNPFILENKCS